MLKPGRGLTTGLPRPRRQETEPRRQETEPRRQETQPRRPQTGPHRQAPDGRHLTDL
jgi:hypothetical protein